MLLEIIIGILLGCLIGIITGIVPGIHVNLVAVLLISLAPLLLQITSPLILAVFIISLAIVHTFLDALPSIYLGAPDEAQALNALPGHRLLIKGEGHNAIMYTIIGSLGTIILGVALFPIFILSMRWLSPFISPIIGYLLILIMTYMILREKQRLKCLCTFLLAGALGLIVFSIPNLNQPLFPLLSGMFGFSLLIISLSENSTIPPQETSKPLTISSKAVLQSTTAATGMGFIAAFLPGFGSSQAAIIATNFTKNIGDEGFLSLVSGINTSNMLLSIAAAYTIQKARNGAIVTVHEIFGLIGMQEMIIFLSVAITAAGIGALLTIYASKIFAKLIVKVNYQRLIIGILLFITILTIYFDGIIGLLILSTATGIGLLASTWKIGKSHLMGCLILPVILYFIL